MPKRFNPGVKLTIESVQAIRRRWLEHAATGQSYYGFKLKLAKEFGVSTQAISDILTGVTWSWLKPTSAAKIVQAEVTVAV